MTGRLGMDIVLDVGPMSVNMQSAFAGPGTTVNLVLQIVDEYRKERDTFVARYEAVTVSKSRSLFDRCKGAIAWRLDPVRPRSIVWWVRGICFSNAPVIAKLGRGSGLKIRVYPHDVIGKNIYKYGVFEADEVNLIMTLLEPGMIFLDAGANIGQYTVLGASRVGDTGRVHAFEPSPRVFKQLQYNVELNVLSSVCVLNNMALSNESGTARLSQCAPGAEVYGSLGNAHWVREPIIGYTEVVTATIDSYCTSMQVPRVDLIKMDIEGAELLALRGSERILRGPASPAIVLEMADANTAGFGYEAIETWDYLGALGYKFYSFERRDGTLVPAVRPSDFLQKPQNLLAVRPPVRPSWKHLLRD